MKVINKLFSLWPKDIQEKLRKLSNSGGEIDGSGMVDLTYSNESLDTFVIMLNDEPVGWSIYSKEFYQFRTVVMVFVSENFRCKGIGNKLVKAVSDKYGNCYGFIWDEISSSFYGKSKFITGFYDQRVKKAA